MARASMASKAWIRATNAGVAAVALLVQVGCASSSRPPDPFAGSAAAASTLRVEVANNNFNDATIYYSQTGGPERRVGDVVGNARRTFHVPLQFTGDVRFRIELLADGWCTMHPIVLSPGDVIELQIVPDFPGAANCERVGGN